MISDPKPETLPELVKAGADVLALVQLVLRESYLEATENLRLYAEKVRFYNQLKRQMREELSRAREHLANYPEASPLDEIDPLGKVRFTSSLTEDEHGCVRVQTIDVGEAMTVKELECYIERLELELATVGDDSQLANVDLQNMLQKQQQALQMMSNISKMSHETAMAVIRNIKG